MIDRALLLVSLVVGALPSLTSPDLAQGPFSSMHMMLQKTILNLPAHAACFLFRKKIGPQPQAALSGQRHQPTLLAACGEDRTARPETYNQLRRSARDGRRSRDLESAVRPRRCARVARIASVVHDCAVAAAPSGPRPRPVGVGVMSCVAWASACGPAYSEDRICAASSRFGQRRLDSDDSQPVGQTGEPAGAVVR